MPASTIDDILKSLQGLQAELEAAIDQLLKEKREQFNYTLEKGKVRFARSIKVLQRHQKIGLWPYLRDAPLAHIVSSPLIYSLIVPFVLMDIAVTIYQQVCFRIYGIPMVQRKDHIVMDRQHLAYLNLIEKINCVYCGYSNGLIAYVREIAARTEQYWCPVKHTRRTTDPHHLMQAFSDYGDAEHYQARMAELRQELASLKRKSTHV